MPYFWERSGSRIFGSRIFESAISNPTLGARSRSHIFVAPFLYSEPYFGSILRALFGGLEPLNRQSSSAARLTCKTTVLITTTYANTTWCPWQVPLDVLCQHSLFAHLVPTVSYASNDMPLRSHKALCLLSITWLQAELQTSTFLPCSLNFQVQADEVEAEAH